MTPDELYRRLSQTSIIAYDTETSGLDWRKDYICGHVITLPKIMPLDLFNAPDEWETYYFPVRHPNHNYDPDIIEAIITHQAGRPDLTIVAHNAAFDLKFAAKHGINFRGPIYDTQIEAALVNELAPSFSLESCAKTYGATPKQTMIYEYLAGRFGLDIKDKSVMGHFHKLDGNDLMAHQYACGDGNTTMALHGALMLEIQAQQLERVHEVESNLIPILHDMSWRGWKIDEERLEWVRTEAIRLRDAAARGLPDINFKSPIAMEKLFRDAGYTQFEMTASGRPSFAQAWLATNELGQKIIAVRKWSTLLSSFIEPIQKEHLYHGRLHTNFNQLKADEFGTISGRISATAPNVLNFPSPKRQPDQGNLFRQIFIPDDGMELAEADYNQAEPRLVAHYAEIPAWITGYNSDPPIDAHDSVARMTGLSRQRGKTVSMALITGAGTNKIIEMLGVNEAEGQQIVNAYHRGVPQIKKFQKYAADIFRRRGYVKSILGRRFHLEEDRFSYRALSRIIQGSNADICKLALTKVAQIDGVQLLNSIYDSIIWQTTNSRYNTEVCQAMTELPELNLRVPMAVDLGSGVRWSECATG